jgi:hypothetical protein
MKIAVLRETTPGERRVAATPETVRKFIGLGATLAVEAGAGEGASIADQAYADAGATIADRATVLAGADILLGVQGPDPVSLAGVKQGAWLAAGLNPFGERPRVDAYAAAGIEALAMEFMPRITRAQSMDILSSQSNLSGYKAVLDAAAEYGRAFPMMMTAAGTVRIGGTLFRDGRRRRRAAGDRDRTAAGCTGFRHRRSLRYQGTDPVARRKAHLRRECKGHRGRRLGRLRHRNVRRISEGAGRARLQPHRQAGYCHHDGADPGPCRA